MLYAILARMKPVFALLIVLSIVFVAVFSYFYMNQQSNKGSASSPSPKVLKKVKIGIVQVSSLLQYYVAREKGYFTEEELEVEAIPMQGGAVIAPAVASGDVNIGWSATGPLIIAHDGGFDFQYITGGAFKNPQGADFQEFLVRADSAIKNPKDLEGKKFAISVSGSNMDLLMGAWTKKHGVDLKKITLVEIPWEQMEAALVNKQIDAGLFNEPYLTLALEQGSARVLDDAPFNAVATRFMLSSWFAKKDWIEKNPEIVAAFNRAIEKATKYINNSPADIPAIMAKNTKLEEETIKKMKQPLFDTVIRKGDIQTFIDAFGEYNLIKKGFSEQEMVSGNIAGY